MCVANTPEHKDVAYRQEMFRKRFANTYELINSELLTPTFISPLMIMMSYNMLNITPEIIPYTLISYVNQLSKASDMNDVNSLVSFTQVVAQLNQAQQLGVYLDLPKTVTFVAEKMDIPKELIPTEKELVQIQEQKRAQAQQMQQLAVQQAMSGEGGQVQ